MLVRVQNLKKYFGETKAVDDISFTFAPGEIVGFVGPNGAGKTTTMRILATLDDPTDGEAFVDGISAVQEPEKARRLVGFMPDSLPTHSDMTVHEYLDFFARAYGIRNPKRRKIVDGIEQFTNLAGIREKFLNALSKGMKQRVSLARSLVHDPPVLILDEPAAGLDPRARIELRELIKSLAEQGKAILISSHILTELAEICTGAVIIEQGKLLADGTLREIESAQKQKHTIMIRTVDRQDELYKELLQMPHVEGARILGDMVAVEIAGAEEVSCNILSYIVQAGFRISEFRQEKANLEDIFMSVTKGQVQ